KRIRKFFVQLSYKNTIIIKPKKFKFRSKIMEYVYYTDVTWKGEYLGEIKMGNGPVMEFSAPPDAHGHTNVLTPEDAFIAAVNTCIMMMFIWACERFKINLVDFACHAEGVKKIALDRTETFTHVILQPRIVARETTQKKIEKALKSAQKYSLIANSITSDLIIEPEIIIEH
ncbi:MAG: OsmC family protein, partial [Promethearchaeota archaeon]